MAEGFKTSDTGAFNDSGEYSMVVTSVVAVLVF